MNWFDDDLHFPGGNDDTTSADRNRKLDDLDQESTGNDVTKSGDLKHEFTSKPDQSAAPLPKNQSSKVSCISKEDSIIDPQNIDSTKSDLKLAPNQKSDDDASIENPNDVQTTDHTDNDVLQSASKINSKESDARIEITDSDQKLNSSSNVEKFGGVNETVLFPTTDSLDLCNFNTMDLLSDEQVMFSVSTLYILAVKKKQGEDSTTCLSVYFWE